MELSDLNHISDAADPAELKRNAGKAGKKNQGGSQKRMKAKNFKIKTFEETKLSFS